MIGLELLVLPIEPGWLVAGVLAIPVLTWGGLRGGISVAMALSLPANDSGSLWC